MTTEALPESAQDIEVNFDGEDKILGSKYRTVAAEQEVKSRTSIVGILEFGEENLPKDFQMITNDLAFLRNILYSLKTQKYSSMEHRREAIDEIMNSLKLNVSLRSLNIIKIIEKIINATRLIEVSFYAELNVRDQVMRRLINYMVQEPAVKKFVLMRLQQQFSAMREVDLQKQEDFTRRFDPDFTREIYREFGVLIIDYWTFRKQFQLGDKNALDNLNIVRDHIRTLENDNNLFPILANAFKAETGEDLWENPVEDIPPPPFNYLPEVSHYG